MYPFKFNKIRPYNDSEVSDAINRIINEKSFRKIISFLYKDKNINDILKSFKNVATVNEFQFLFSHYAVNEIIRRTFDKLYCSGIENLDTNKVYLFVANHRDIVLDSAIMQALLVKNNHKTSQITFGSNLMFNDFIVDLGKLNKMFTFYRGGTKTQIYKNALLHSEYIRHVITEKKESIWIAQRDGRTKNGDDRTQIALIKMFVMGKKKKRQILEKLNIVPVTISYEFEPCDAQKIQELYISKRGTYKKQKLEDLNNIINGITDYKGRVHMAFGIPVNDCNKQLPKNINNNDFINTIVENINYQTHKNYHIWERNYIAFDIINKTNKYLGSKYKIEQKDKFIDYVNRKTKKLDGNKYELSNMLFSMYAMPVINKNNIENRQKFSVNNR